jgi:hypothetical protein
MRLMERVILMCSMDRRLRVSVVVGGMEFASQPQVRFSCWYIILLEIHFYVTEILILSRCLFVLP